MKKGKKKKHQLTFWKRIRFKYKLSFLNENTLEEVFSIRLSRLSAYLMIFFFGVILILLTSIVIINTPIRNYLPGYLDAEVRMQMMNSALRADSLEQVLQAQTTYIGNITTILRGDMPVDSLMTARQRTKNLNDSLSRPTEAINIDKSETTVEFVRKYEEAEKYNLTTISTESASPADIKSGLFFKPTIGMVTSHYSADAKHYGVDIAARNRESVMSTMKGTVVYTGYDDDSGYVIQIQHPNGFVSFYKHNEILLKTQGQSVAAGEAIALVGNTGRLSSGPHLHFELWYNGKPVNPEEFIIF